ncbi:M1 family metallopeptidase [Microaerobacter geothermalis]|uniref:M1 family metallopeptidase n=1 Tax=Microaerobacter geothermalis TaxID=674972 RepID=UPI001F16B4F9|nr:M1 family metallopeptidase [Microaerobacter geothermalis]MCF6093704.1 M1 family metallopeptidase [Microaerobacter geothermalis]
MIQKLDEIRGVVLFVMVIFSIILSLPGCSANKNTTNENIANDSEITTAPEITSGFSQEMNLKWIRNFYDYSLTYDPEKKILTGNGSLVYVNDSKDDLYSIVLQLYLNAFSSNYDGNPVLPRFAGKAYPHGKKYGKISINQITSEGVPLSFLENTLSVIIDLPQPLHPGDSFPIDLQFSADIPDIRHRVGSTPNAQWFGNVLPSFGVYDNGEWLSYPYYPIGEPYVSNIADYKIKLMVPKGWEVIATGEKTKTEAVDDDDWVKYWIEAENVRDFLFAIVKEYKVQTLSTDNGTLIHFYYRKADDKTVDQLLNQVARSIEYFSRRVGPYPYKELDLLENNMFITGMEYPGMVLIREDRMNPEGLNTIIHEVAHQWFYNLIGNDQVREPWLDEGFATYLTDEFIQGDNLTRYYQQLKKGLHGRILNEGTTLSFSTSQFSDWGPYWRQAYGKGSLFLFSLREKIGDDAFSQLLKSLYRDYQSKIIQATDVQRVAEKIFGNSLDDFFAAWLNGKGIPNHS